MTAITPPSPCPECGADWRNTELTGAARKGGGYHVLCHLCEHEWDDVHASHMQRENAWRALIEAADSGREVQA